MESVDEIMIPDIITVWPIDTYYPLFVKQMNRDRDLFGRIIVVMTPGNPGFDFTKDVKQEINNATVISPDILKLTAGGKDWRNVAVNEGYKLVRSDYVLHLEQDFIAGENFYKDLIEKGDGLDMVGIKEESRFHPCCLLMNKQAVEKTDKDYSAHPPEYDHFGKITSQIKSSATLEELGLKDFYHISGLTHNFRIKDVFHRIDEFYTYLIGSDLLEQPKRWKDFCINKAIEVGKREIVDDIMKFF